MTFNLVTKNLIDAIADANSWEQTEGAYYKDKLNVCLKPEKTLCFGQSTWDRRISDLVKAGATSDDIDFWKRSADSYSRYRCILPAGHSGSCKFNSNGITNNRGLKLKIDDAVNNPGATGIFMNRAGAICAYPVMEKAAADTIKSSGITNVAVRLERAATSYQMATALLDTIAMASLLKNSKEFLVLDNKFKEMIFSHREFLIKHHKETYGVSITNSNGFLCGPILPDTYKEFSIDQFGSGTGTDDYDSIQFTHIFPVTDNKFMSRGLNVWFATKLENGLMLKNSYTESKKIWKEASLDR